MQVYSNQLGFTNKNFLLVSNFKKAVTMGHLKLYLLFISFFLGWSIQSNGQCLTCGPSNDNAELAGSHNILNNPQGNSLNGWNNTVDGSLVLQNFNTGEDNVIQDNVSNSMISGEINTMEIDVTNGFISGAENNMVSCDRSSVFGYNNEIDGADQSFIFGSGLSLGRSQTFLVGWNQDRYFEVNTDIGYVIPDFGVGLTNPTHQLHVDGGIRIGNTNNAQPGAIRYNSNVPDFEGFVNGNWVSLTASGGTDNDWTNDQTNNYVYNNQTGYQIGIQTSTPSTELDVDGTITCNNITTVSDTRLKDNVESLDNSLDLINDLEGVTYEFKKQDDMNLADDQQYGFIAQEVEKVLPSLVNTPEEGYKSLEYQQFIPILTNAVKEQQEQIVTQEQTIDNLKDRVAELEAQVQDGHDDPETGSRDATSGARLYDNAPNPFDIETTIRYEIEEGSNASIQVYNMKGEQMNSYALEEAEGSITISARTFEPGMYMYSLVAGGEVVDTKRMMITAGR